MSVADKSAIARRPVLSGLVGLAALAGIAALEAPRLFSGIFGRRYPPTAFDDLLTLLPDRENAILLGAALTRTRPLMDVRGTAERLRRKIGGHSLAAAIADDLEHGRFVEAQGWLLPESLAELCALAAVVPTA